MRCLYLLTEFPPAFGGGIATVYGNLLPRLAELGHDITVLLANHSQLDQPNYEWRGIQVQPLQSPYLSRGEAELQAWQYHAFLHYFLPTAWAAWHQAQELGGFDVVEVTDWALLFLPWLVHARSQPVVVSLHGSCGQVDWHGNPKARSGEGQLVRLLETAVLPLADKLIANSELNAEFWWHQCGVRPQVIPPLFEARDDGESVLIAEQSLRQRLSSNRGVVVARLQNWKGPDVLCRALRLLPGQEVDWIGLDTPWEETSISTSEHLRRLFPDVVDHQLHLVGPLPPDQVRIRLSQAAFLLCPSFFDVFNVTVLEAIEAGVPVICSRQAGASMLIEDGLTGFLFDSHKPQELSEAIRRFQQLPPFLQENIAVMAKTRARSRMHSDAIVSSVLTEYFTAIRNWRPRESNVWLAPAMQHGLGGSLGQQPTCCLHHRFPSTLTYLASRVLNKLKSLLSWPNS